VESRSIAWVVDRFFSLRERARFALCQRDPIDGSGDVDRVVRRTERVPENAKPGPEAASPIGAYSETSGDALRGHVSRHHTVA
jgi:hypothetical protein